jgi:hypothetical protein
MIGRIAIPIGRQVAIVDNVVAGESSPHVRTAVLPVYHDRYRTPVARLWKFFV